MLPVKLAALNGVITEAEAISRSWHAGMVACMGSGWIEIALGFLLRTYAHPLVGLTSLAVIVLGYHAKVRWPLPTGLMAVLLGMVLAWSSGLLAQSPDSWQESIRTISWHPPTLQLQILWDNRTDLFPWLGVIVPMGLFNVIGSLQNL